MDFFERELLSGKLPGVKNIFKWFRYVDDVFCIWQGTPRQLDGFVKSLNMVNKAIQFQTEVEQNGTLHFLDLEIRQIDSKLELGIFRKNSATDQTIHASSRHHISQKLAAFHSLLYRMITIPMPEVKRERELSTIKEIAISNGYSESLINKLY
jgi:hypothetical protein